MRSHFLRGFAVLIAMLLAAVLASVALAWAARAAHADRDVASDHALRQAREALLAYAADRAIDREVGPGYLPCPDRDGDGWAEATCGSLAGDIGQSQRLGWLPWKTLGLPELRDGHGERLWYAVSTRYKGLLNCAASVACTDLSPPKALGTISVRAPDGSWIHDGRIGDPARAVAGGAAAVVIAAGAPLPRAGDMPSRACGASCPAQFLDAHPLEDNAAFVDRSDTRAGNGDGFLAGPAPGVNDRVVAIGYGEIVPRVMARVAIEAAHCVRLRAAREGAWPLPQPACGSASPLAPAGRVPDVDIPGCLLSADGWWRHWRAHVWYGVAPACEASGRCIEMVDRDGSVAGRGHAAAITVSPQPGGCAPARMRCDAAECTRVQAGDALEVAHAFR